MAEAISVDNKLEFGKLSSRLITAISSCISGVIDKVYAAGLIEFEVKSELVQSDRILINTERARRLVDVLENKLRISTSPDVFINKFCTVLRSMGERNITEIAATLERNVKDQLAALQASKEETDGGSAAPPTGTPVPPNVPNPPDVSKFFKDVPGDPPKEYGKDDVDIHDVNILLVTATETEFRAVIGCCTNDIKDIIEVDYEEVTFYLGWYDKYHVAIIETGQTERRTTPYVKKVQEVVNAEYVIAIGICYGMDMGKIKLGDIIVPENIKDVTNKKMTSDETLIRVNDYRVNKDLLNTFSKSQGFKLENNQESEHVKIKVGVLVSEDTLVSDEKHKKKVILNAVPEALGGEMEGYGLMRLAEDKNYKAIVLKAVADYGDENKKYYKIWQPFAAVAAAQYVLSRLKRYPERFKKQPMTGTESQDEQLG